MKEITDHFLKAGILDVSSSGLVTEENPVVCRCSKVLCDPNSRFMLSYYLEKLTFEKYAQTPTAIVALGAESLPFGVLLCQKNSKYSELLLECLTVSDIIPGQQLQNQINDNGINHAKVLLVIDVFYSYHSVSPVADFLKRRGADVLGILCLFSYNRPKDLAALKKKKLPLTALSSQDEISLCLQEAEKTVVI